MTQAQQPQDPRLKMELAVAVARERVAELHLAQALGFVRHLAGRVAGSRAITMYSRLHRLTDEQHRNLVTAVLAAFGRSAAWSAPAEGAVSDMEWSDTSTVLERVKRRLAGRRNRELRKWVEHYTGHTERLLLETHVDHAVRFLATRGEDPDIAVGVWAYMEALSIRESLFEALHILVLDRLHREAQAAMAGGGIGRGTLRVVGDGG